MPLSDINEVLIKSNRPRNQVKIARKGYTDSPLRISSGQRKARIHKISVRQAIESRILALIQMEIGLTQLHRKIVLSLHLH
jgi:hypothetical protein